MKRDFRQKPNTSPSNFNMFGAVKIKIMVVFIAIIGVLVSAQLVFANNLATDGAKLSHINEEIRFLESENTIIRSQIAEESSFVTLSQKAKELGFEKPSQIIIP